MKKILKYIGITLLIFIYIYDTYETQVVKKNKANTLNIEYENAGNILLSDIKNGDAISMRIKVDNKTDKDINFFIDFEEVVNSLSCQECVTYSLTKNNKSVSLYSGYFPTSNVLLNTGDVVSKNTSEEYDFIVRIANIDEIDKGKNLQTRIKFVQQ